MWTKTITTMAKETKGYSNDRNGKLSWLLNSHYNLYHADIIYNAMHDDNVSIQDFIHGCTMIHAEEGRDNDEFVPDEFEHLK